MAVLLDVNVLLALTSAQHEHAHTAAIWFNGISPGDGVVCRVAQLGLLRLLNDPAVLKEEALDATTCWETWDAFTADSRIRVEYAEPDGLEREFRRLTRGKNYYPKLWTDAYLAAYASAANLKVATLDRTSIKFADIDVELVK